MKVQEFARFRDIQQIESQRLYLVIPEFTLAVPPWSGASTLLAEYPIGNSYWFTLRLAIRAFGSNFIAAVRYIDDDRVIRYTLFANKKAVLYFPLYAGDVLGPNAVVEIWSVNSTAAPMLAANKVLETSVLAFQTNSCSSCCSNPDAYITLIAADAVNLSAGDPCNPFCEAPLVSVYIPGLPPVVPPVIPPPDTWDAPIGGADKFYVKIQNNNPGQNCTDVVSYATLFPLTTIAGVPVVFHAIGGNTGDVLPTSYLDTFIVEVDQAFLDNAVDLTDVAETSSAGHFEKNIDTDRCTVKSDRTYIWQYDEIVTQMNDQISRGVHTGLIDDPCLIYHSHS